MNIVSTFLYSFKKSRKLAKLQRIISPPNRTIEDVMCNVTSHHKEDIALEQYLDFCMTDIGVSKILEDYDLSREDLMEAYHDLERNGCGQYVKGHYVSLSTIAYMETLQFYLDAKTKK